MSIKDEEIKKIESDIAKAKKAIDLGSALERLSKHKDFRAVIDTGYLEQEAIRLVHAKADPACQTVTAQADIIRQIDAIGALSTYFRVIRHHADMATKSIADSESMVEQLLSENDEG